MKDRVRVVLYCRVSTDLQEKEQTVQSQLEDLRKHAHEKGYEIVAEYLDDGYSGGLLQRPGLDALRDALSSGDFNAVLFHSPDRLARKSLYQSLVLEELERAGVKAKFLNFTVDDSPEGRMLLDMQGIFAEYERTKITERTRRGKLHWARKGALVARHVPYGYRFMPRSDSQRAHLKLDEEQAVIVRQMFRWLVEEGMSTRAIARRLTEAGVATARGANQWYPTAVDRMLRNTAYRGVMIYHRMTYGNANDPKRPKAGIKIRPEEEWIEIEVPSIVDESIWYAAQAQLTKNSQYSSRNNTKHQYLLRGLIRCLRCGATYTGMAKKGRPIYRCRRTDPAVSSTGVKCQPGSVRADVLEEAVWTAVSEALRRPDLLKEEYAKKLVNAGAPAALEIERKQTQVALKRVKIQQDRLTDAYLNEAIDMERYKSEMDKLRNRCGELEYILHGIDRREQQEHDTQEALQDLERFCYRISEGLDSLTFDEKQKLLRLLVERITVEDGRVRIDAVIPTSHEEGIIAYTSSE